MAEPWNLQVATRFRGPPRSGNGGYVCGRLAAYLPDAKIRLVQPPPLERDIAVWREGDALKASAADVVVASGRRDPFELEVPRIPSLQEAERAVAHYVGFGAAHPFRGCFVCGPDRSVGDGLRIFTGPLDDGLVAAPFAPPCDLLDASGQVLPEIVWAALDCPGYFAITGAQMAPMLLGELAAKQLAPVRGGPLVAFGWSIGREGRKAYCGSALASPEGELLAIAKATWISLLPGHRDQ